MTPGVLPPTPKDGPRVGSIHDPGVVKIDRSTKWGNPFVLGRDGDRATVIAKYEEWVKTQPELMAALPELRGRSLGCHCAPLPCHGDVLMRLANPDTPVSRDWDAGARADGGWDTAPVALTGPPITSFRGEHAFLSNFHESPVTIDGITYPTAEHAFQAFKTSSTEERVRISQIRNAAEAKRYGGSLPLSGERWAERRDAAMRTVLEAKFSNPEMRRLLDATAGSRLIENNTWGDTYWGVSRGKGQNRLGTILMEIRDGKPDRFDMSDTPEGFGRITDETADQMATAAGVPQDLARAAQRDAADAALAARVASPEHKAQVEKSIAAAKAYQSVPVDQRASAAEGKLIAQAQQFNPEWDRLGQRRLNVEDRPQLNPTLPEDAFRLRQWEEREAVLTQPYTLWESERADRWWAEAADQYIQSAGYRIANTPKGMEFVSEVRESQMLHSALEGIADQIDMDIRLARVGETPMNPWRGAAAIPERVVDRAVVSKRDQASVREAGGRELNEAEARRERRFKNVTKWDEKSPREQALIRRRDAVYGIVRDKDGNVVKSEVTVVVDKEGVKHVRGGKKVTERRDDQMGLGEDGETVYPNKPAKKERDWREDRDSLDADSTTPVLEVEGEDPMSRTISDETRPIESNFYGGRDEMLSGEGGTVEVTTPTNVPPRTPQPERPKKISTAALATIKRAEDIYTKTYGKPPRRIRKDGVGMEAYGPRDRKRMEDIIREMAYKG